MNPDELRAWIGDIDIYLFDQILRGRIPPGSRLLDAGCGGGRNLVYFLRNGYDVSGIDASPAAVAAVRALAGRLAPALPPENFRNETVERTTFADASFDVVLSVAVLHFAANESGFRAMLREMWRLLRPGGVLFCRIASLTGMDERAVPIGDGRYHLPDGTDRFLVNEPMLRDCAGELGAGQIDPIKTVIVENMRAMTTWCLEKQL
ncbi:MAG: Methyltransferase type 11 [Chlorobi bacterium]|nr:Methyltransferase type 11 [Chlorobiota bacterium]